MLDRNTGKPVEISGVLKERMNNGRRAIKLRQGERRTLLRQQRVETAVSMFLDLRQSYSWQDIADDLDISVMALKDLTKTKEFNDCYNSFYVELGHDPRLKASQMALTDLLPNAVQELRGLLTSAETPPSVKIKVIQEIFKQNGLGAPESNKSDRGDLAKFLKDVGVNIENVNVLKLPDEYERAEKEYVDAVTEIKEEPPTELLDNPNVRVEET
jgi:hypothetical protein